MNDKNIEEMQDRQAISDIVLQYATGADTRNRSLYRACFTDPVTVDFTSFSDGEVETIPVDVWVDRVWGLLPGFDSTQHVSTNHVHTINGDKATCVSYMVAEHILVGEPGEDYVTLGGYYTNDLVRTPLGWKITKCRLTVTWRRGNEALFETAASRAAALPS